MNAILVLGAARSGTTFLGNLVAAHPRVASVSHPLHWGQKENNLATLALCFPDLGDDDRYIEFIERYASSDYVSPTGIDRLRYYKRREADVHGVFLSTMEGLCEARGATHWTSKYDPLLESYPTVAARFRAALAERGHGVCWLYIRRDPVSMARSYLGMEGEHSKWKLGWLLSRCGIVLQLARAVRVWRQANTLAAEGENVLETSFEELVADPGSVAKRAFSLAGLEAAEAEVARALEAMPRNSSPARGRWPLRSWEMRTIRGVSRALHTAPGSWVAGALVGGRERLRRARRPFSWRILRATWFRAGLLRQLEESGQSELAAQVSRHPSP